VKESHCNAHFYTFARATAPSTIASTAVCAAATNFHRIRIVTDTGANGGDERRNAREYFLRLLDERDRELAALYAAGVHLFNIGRFGGRSRLLAHMVREVRRDLPSLFARTKKPKKLEYHNRLKNIAERWERDIRPQFGGLASAVPLPGDIADEIDLLLVDDAAVSVTLRQQFLEMCNEVNREVLRWHGNPHLAHRWMNGLAAAEELAHNGGGAEDEERAERLFTELDDLVLLIFRPASDRERMARESAESVTPSTVLAAVATLVTMPDHAVFYKNLRRADVLPTLRRAQVFRIAGGEAEPTYWPEADYLANVAAEQPVEVAEILASLRATNPGVVRQLLAVALNLPDARLAWVTERAQWLHESQSLTLYGGYIDVINRTVRAGKVCKAFDLAASLLRLRSEPDPLGIFVRERNRAAPLIGGNAFKDALSRLVSALGSLESLRIMALLADTLDAALVIEDMHEYDMSSSWLPDILNSDAGRYFVAGETAGALSDLAFNTAKDRVDDVLTFLDGRKPDRVYERIALAIIVRCDVAAKAAERLRDERLWLRRGPEHLALVEKFYPGLDAEARATVFKLARATLEPWFRSPLINVAKAGDYSDDDRIFANLGAAFGSAVDAVPEPHRSRLRQAVQATQPAATAAFPDEDVLAGMSPLEVVAELQQASATAFDDSWSVGQTVWRLVERDTDKWLAGGAIMALSDQYLGWALHGLRNQRNASKPLHDRAVLPVAEDAVRRATELAARDGDAELAGARALAQPAGLILADLARDATDAETLNRIVASAAVLGGMTPTRRADAQDSPSNASSAALGDPHALAVTVAGEALKAAVRQNLEKRAIFDLYDAHTHEASLAVRATLGGEFAFFAGWDQKRADEWALRIFLSGDELSDQAAWAGYVLHSQLTRVTYSLLRPAYIRRISDVRRDDSQASNVGEAVQSSDDRQVHEKTLAHAWILAWNGEEPVERDDSLIRLALDAASAELVEALLRTVARDLERPGPDPKVREAITSEAMRLWVLVRAGVDSGRHPASVVAAFALWARPTILPASWRLAEIESLLKIPDIDLAREWDLVQGLVALADDDMPRALRALRDLARRRDVSAMTAMSQYAGPLLRSARAAGSESGHLAVEINSILMNNFYRDLLNGTPD